MQRSSALPRPQSYGAPHGILTPRTLSSSSHQLASSSNAWQNPRRVWMSEPTPLHFIGSLKTWFVTERSVARSCRAFRSHIHEFSELFSHFSLLVQTSIAHQVLHRTFSYCTALLRASVRKFCCKEWTRSLLRNFFATRLSAFGQKLLWYLPGYGTFVTLLQHKLLLYRACSNIRIQTRYCSKQNAN